MKSEQLLKDDLIKKFQDERIVIMQDAKRNLPHPTQSKIAERIAYEVVFTESIIWCLMNENVLSERQILALLSSPFVLAKIHEHYYSEYLKKMREYLTRCIFEIADQELAEGNPQ